MPYNPASLSNLTPFSKGQSGNPAGRPPIDRDIQEFADAPSEESGKTRKQKILDVIYQKALSFGGNLKACEILLDRICGRESIVIRHYISKEPDAERNITPNPSPNGSS